MTKGRTSWLAAALVTGLLLALSTATVTADSQTAFTAKLTLTGDQEVIGTTCAPPAVCGDPDAVGTAKVQIVPALDRVCVRIDWTGIDGQVWGAHIHGPATPTTAAGILVPLLMLTPGAADNLSGTDSLDVCVTDADADAIAANPSAYYLNVHSFPDFNPGAIRAQLD
jgi:hypothetical protein